MKALAICLAPSALFFSLHAAAADLRVEVHGASGAGKVYAALFNRAEDFLKTDRAIASTIVAPGNGSASFVFSNLAPGAYAVSVYQDANGNGQLDRNLLGVPREPYGFSRDASALMGPPKFADAALEIKATDVVARITLR